MTINDIATDLYEFAVLNGGWITLWRYLKFKSYEPEGGDMPRRASEIVDAIILLQEQGRGTFFRDQTGEIDGVFIGPEHASRALAHRHRQVQKWATALDQPSDDVDLPF